MVMNDAFKHCRANFGIGYLDQFGSVDTQCRWLGLSIVGVRLGGEYLFKSSADVERAVPFLDVSASALA